MPKENPPHDGGGPKGSIRKNRDSSEITPSTPTAKVVSFVTRYLSVAEPEPALSNIACQLHIWRAASGEIVSFKFAGVADADREAIAQLIAWLINDDEDQRGWG